MCVTDAIVVGAPDVNTNISHTRTHARTHARTQVSLDNAALVAVVALCPHELAGPIFPNGINADSFKYKKRIYLRKQSSPNFLC